MKRRTFLRTAAAGLALPMWNGWVLGADRPAGTPLEFLRERTEGMVIPRPEPGIAVDVSPPGFVWLPAQGATDYRLRIQSGAGSSVYEALTGSDPLHRPDKVLPPGPYRWDIQALGEGGAEGPWRGWHDFSIAEGAPELPMVDAADLLARVPREHPRILYSRENLEEIRATLTTTRKQAWAGLKKVADAALDGGVPEPPTYHLNEDRTKLLLEYVKYFQYFRRHVNNNLQTLSLAWLVSGDERYAAAAKKILLTVAAYPTGDDDVSSVRAKWGDEVGLSLSKVGHLAYDWLYDALSEDERGTVRKMCVARADQAYRMLRDQNYFTRSGGSHQARLLAYLPEQGIGLAHEADGPEDWMRWSLKGLTTFYPHWGGRDGGWAEGISYGLAYNGFYVPGFESLRRLTGFDLWKIPFFRKNRWFFVYCTTLRGEMNPYGDGAEAGGPRRMSGPEGWATLMNFHAHRFDDRHLSWFIRELNQFDSYTGVAWSMLYPDALPEPEPPTDIPQSRGFFGVGWAGLHSDLADPANDTFLVFKSSPYGSLSHSHADQNSFSIMKGGHALAIPSGYYGPAYGAPHHARWTRSTKATNSVLVNGEGQAGIGPDGLVTRDQNAQGRLVKLDDQPGHTYLLGDAAQAYLGKMKQFDRHILFLRPGLFLLLDELAAPAPAKFQWMLHAIEQMELTPAQGKVVSSREGTKLSVWLRERAGDTAGVPAISQTNEFDTPFEIGMPEGFSETRPKQWHVTAETRAAAPATRIGAVMRVTGSGESAEVDRITDEAGWLGVVLGDLRGWVQVVPGAAAPAEASDIAGPAMAGAARIIARDRDGKVVVI